MAVDPLSSGQTELQRWNTQLVGAEHTLSSAQSEAEAKVRELNALKLRDKDGNIIQCDTVEKWLEAFKKGNVKYADGNYVLGGPDDNNSVSNRVKVIVEKLEAAKKEVAGLKFDIAAWEAMDELLASGDLLGAFNRLSQTRAKGFDDQIKEQIGQVKSRNEQTQRLNTALGQLNGASPRDEKEIGRIKGLIEKSNSDTQLQMIDVQDLVSKKQQCFEGMTSMANKWSQMMQQILNTVRA